MKFKIKSNDSKYYPYALYCGNSLVLTAETKKELQDMKTINIMGARRIQNTAKELGITPTLSYGEWNGYNNPLIGRLITLEDYAIIMDKLSTKKAPKVRTDEEIEDAWCRKLAKLGGITFEEAEQIAEEKKEYKEKQIEMMEDRQGENYSSKRQKLINKMERENPLRYITDADHAQAILSASNRHKNTNYEELLDDAREDVGLGIAREDVQDYARQNFK